MPKIGQKPGKSPYAQLVDQWKDCQNCGLCLVRKKVVMAKGSIPADVVMVGEAPGESEDVIGVPFVGPAGKLLGRIVDKAKVDGGYPSVRIAWTNLVGCVPKDDETKRKRGEPLPGEIEACRPRLERLLDLCKPDLIVCVGQLAEKQAKIHNWEARAKIVSIVHPAAILRADITQQGLMVQRCCVQLADAFNDLIPF